MGEKANKLLNPLSEFPFKCFERKGRKLLIAQNKPSEVIILITVLKIRELIPNPIVIRDNQMAVFI